MSDQRVSVCGVRAKFTKSDSNGNRIDLPFQLYTTYSKPGLVNIFFNEDQRCFHNWKFEVGSGKKRGRIREAIDHQINAPVMEIVGAHDGSVYMMCPPDPNYTMHVDLPFVTVLMRDMHGYSSIEFIVLDSMGFSRKISAKNYRSNAVIGELDLEIPMRISPTWNYASINLDGALQNAFGTRLAFVQRIKINSYARIRRVYFSQEIFPYKSLPQEYRIKLHLTPQEKIEVQMFDEFFSKEAEFLTAQDAPIPWSLPKLATERSEINHKVLTSRHSENLQGVAVIRNRVEIQEVPAQQNEPDKYDDINNSKWAHQLDSNAELLRDMLQKSIPPSKILLPTLSLIYPDRQRQSEVNAIQANKVADYLKKRGAGGREGKYFGRSLSPCEHAERDTENLIKLRKCVEQDDMVGVAGEEENEDEILTDWDKINHYTDHHHGHKHHQHHHHHHHHHKPGCSKLDAQSLAKYLKQREVLGGYDLFAGKIKNPKFLAIGIRNEEDGDNDESSSTPDSDSVPDLVQGTEKRKTRLQDGASPRRMSRANLNRVSTMSQTNLRKSSKTLADDNDEMSEDDLGNDSVESWIFSWAYQGLSWMETREINQKLLNDAWVYYANENKRKTMLESSMGARQNAKTKDAYKTQLSQKKFVGGWKSAVPMLPKMKLMRDQLEKSRGNYHLVFDNPSMPIEYY